MEIFHRICIGDFLFLPFLKFTNLAIQPDQNILHSRFQQEISLYRSTARNLSVLPPLKATWKKMSIPRVRPLLAKIADLITHHTYTNSEKSAINYTLKP
jgi:hypothetical protein